MASPDSPRYTAWRSRLERRQRRRDAIELFGVTLAVEVLLFALYVQFRRGLLSDLSVAPVGEQATLAVAVGVVVALFISPVRFGAVVRRFVHGTGSFVIDWLTIAVLTMLYVVLLPVTRLAGRRTYLRRHATSAPWVDRRARWQCSTWTAKRSEADRGTGRGAIWRLLAYFVAQRNLILLLVTIAILIAVSLSALSQSTYLAPFIYTFF